MKKTIAVAGGTGNLGNRIVNALLQRSANVAMLVRKGTGKTKLDELVSRGVQIFEVDMMNVDEIAEACKGAECLVSALQGLREVIVDTQTPLVQAAIKADVSRFIPSDYSTDFRELPTGSNRNFDLRKDFHQFLDTAAIQSTSIFNGAFAEILSYGTPLLNFKNKTVGYWGDNADWKMDFTTMDDTAAYTAEAALDATAPKALRIASFQLSPNDFVRLAKEITGDDYKLINMGSVEAFGEQVKKQRAENPEGENEVFPKWQSAQYMHGMFSKHHASLDNERYASLTWTNAEACIKSLI